MAEMRLEANQDWNGSKLENELITAAVPAVIERIKDDCEHSGDEPHANSALDHAALTLKAKTLEVIQRDRDFRAMIERMQKDPRTQGRVEDLVRDHPAWVLHQFLDLIPRNPTNTQIESVQAIVDQLILKK
ncbi:hypothetical protein HY969_00260 [Candidatus Kaiserbacteria bacterium]|nr:hypothetical protein [Candidatus Kaiserbacteria bacterium]